MAIIPQNSRIKHHTITIPSLTFSVPASEDFTDGSWTSRELCLSELGVNESDKKVYMRIGSEIVELYTTATGLTGVGGATQTLADTLQYGNISGGQSILMSSGDLVQSFNTSDNLLNLRDSPIETGQNGFSVKLQSSNHISLQTTNVTYTINPRITQGNTQSIWLRTGTDGNTFNTPDKGTIVLQGPEIVYFAPGYEKYSNGARFYTIEKAVTSTFSTLVTNTIPFFNNPTYYDKVVTIKAYVTAQSEGGGDTDCYGAELFATYHTGTSITNPQIIGVQNIVENTSSPNISCRFILSGYKLDIEFTHTTNPGQMNVFGYYQLMLVGQSW